MAVPPPEDGEYRPLPAPPPLQTKVTLVRENEIYKRENPMGLVLVYKLFGSPPTPSFTSLATGMRRGCNAVGALLLRRSRGPACVQTADESTADYNQQLCAHLALLKLTLSELQRKGIPMPDLLSEDTPINSLACSQEITETRLSSLAMSQEVGVPHGGPATGPTPRNTPHASSLATPVPVSPGPPRAGVVFQDESKLSTRDSFVLSVHGITPPSTPAVSSPKPTARGKASVSLMEEIPQTLLERLQQMRSSPRTPEVWPSLPAGDRTRRCGPGVRARGLSLGFRSEAA